MNKYQRASEALENLYDKCDVLPEAKLDDGYEMFLDYLLVREYLNRHRWHNLALNKFDLPRNCETVLCWTARDGYLTMYRKGEWWRKTEDDEVYSTTRIATYVKGWKYIEEYEDE